MDNYVGIRLNGRYDVQEIVGVGGVSVIYKAHDNIDDRILAIKILKNEFLNNEKFKHHFRNENKAITRAMPSNITVFDYQKYKKYRKLVKST